MRVLLVEDDRRVAEYIRRDLEDEGNSVTVCFDGAAGLKAAQSSRSDIIVLDVMMPFMDGIEVTKRLRLEQNYTPILLLTARDAPEDVVRGLDAGADDYLVKPFSFDVLLARLRARTRSFSSPRTKLHSGDLSMDLAIPEVRRGNKVLFLTRTEFALLECLLCAGGRVVTRERLIETVWGDKEISGNNLEVFIRFLRTKVDLPGQPQIIQTKRGVGYYLGERK
jgi:two-component system response regulator MprA